MSHFLAVSAVRGVPTAGVAAAIKEVVGRHGVGLEQVQAAMAEDGRDVRLFAAPGWSIILWPQYFNIHDLPMAESLSAELSTVVSTIHVYDDQYWTHGFFEQGRRLDMFASRPRFFDEEVDAAPIDPNEWAGDAELIARSVGVESGAVAGYLVHMDAPGAPTGRVHPDDDFPLDDFWVFVDFWRRLGIHYPADMGTAEASWRLSPGFDRRLPASDGL
jgi:hypothetical protein